MRAAGPLVAGVIVLAAIAAFVMTRGDSVEIESLRAAQAETAAAVDDLRAENTRLETELASERRKTQQADVEAKRLQQELVGAQARLEAVRAAVTEAAPDQVPDVAAPTFPAFTPEGLGDALASVDWDVVAESMSHMPPLIAELAAHLQEGRPMAELSAETIGSIQRYNGPLVTTAMRLSQQGVAGSDVNGAFSHPGFMSNALAATLAELGMPLDDDQTARLDQLTADFSARETKRVASYSDDSYTIEKLVDESHLKHQFFEQVYALLTPAQHDAVRPEAVRGRTQLDIFGEGVAWAGKAGPLVYASRDALKSQAASWIIARAGATASQQEPIQAMVATWVDELPEPFFDWQVDGLVSSGMLQVEHVTDSAARVLDLLRTLDRELDLDAAGHARLRAIPGSIVPYAPKSAD